MESIVGVTLTRTWFSGSEGLEKGEWKVSVSLHKAQANGATNAAGPRVEKVFVTPDMAAEWLQKNVKNRRITPSHLSSLVEILQRGEWKLNGDTIRFGKDGLLKDGQHRLSACVAAGVGFWTFVVYGLDGEAFDTIDTNSRPRRVSDVLDIHGMSNTNCLSAAAKLLWVFRKTGQVFEGGSGYGVGFSPNACLEIIGRHKDLEAIVSSVHSGKRIFPSLSVLAAFSYLFSFVSKEASGELLDVMQVGSPDAGRPFNVLREAMIDRRVAGVRMHSRAVAFMLVRAWNSEMSGMWIKRVYYKSSEEFPRIHGLDYSRLEELI